MMILDTWGNFNYFVNSFLIDVFALKIKATYVKGYLIRNDVKVINIHVNIQEQFYSKVIY